MKIRIRGNAVRFRLTKTEVETFSNTGLYEEKTVFGTKVFTYALRASNEHHDLYAEFVEDTIVMYLPSEASEGWAESKKVGFSRTLVLDNGQELSLLLEKDFVCLDETIEDQSDNYPNPRAAQ